MTLWKPEYCSEYCSEYPAYGREIRVECDRKEGMQLPCGHVSMWHTWFFF